MTDDKIKPKLYLDPPAYAHTGKSRELNERETEVYTWLLNGIELNSLWLRRMKDPEWLEDIDVGKTAFFQEFPVGVPLECQKEGKISLIKGKHNKQKEIFF